MLLDVAANRLNLVAVMIPCRLWAATQTRPEASLLSLLRAGESNWTFSRADDAPDKRDGNILRWWKRQTGSYHPWRITGQHRRQHASGLSPGLATAGQGLELSIALVLMLSKCRWIRTRTTIRSLRSNSICWKMPRPADAQRLLFFVLCWFSTLSVSYHEPDHPNVLCELGADGDIAARVG